MTTERQPYTQADGAFINESVKRTVEKIGGRFAKENRIPMTTMIMTDVVAGVENALHEFRLMLRATTPAKFMKQARTNAQQKQAVIKASPDERLAVAKRVGTGPYVRKMMELFPEGELPPDASQEKTPLVTPNPTLDGPSIESSIPGAEDAETR